MEKKQRFILALTITALIILLILSVGLGLLIHGAASSNSPKSRQELNASSKSMLNQLREEIRDNATHPYMLRDKYLEKWLIEKNWDIGEAKEMFLEHLLWREEQGIEEDEEGKEDATGEMEMLAQEFPIFTDGVDKEGRPVVSVDLAEWDLRKLKILGRGEKFLRFIYSKFEKVERMLDAAQEKGEDVDQIVVILNLEGLSIVQHGCSYCIPHLLNVLNGLDANYPQIIYKIFLVNVPDDLTFLLNLVPFSISKNLETFGKDKEKWRKEILNLIEPQEIREQFGGTKQE